MFISNPLQTQISYRDNRLKILIQNPEQKYIGKICKIVLTYNFIVLIGGGENLQEIAGSTEIVLTEFDTTIEIPVRKRYEYDWIDIQFYYSMKLDIIDAFGLFNATKEEKIVIQKDLSFTTATLQNTETVPVVDVLQSLSNKSYIWKDKFNWKIMLQRISFLKKIFLGLILIFILCGIVNIIFPRVIFWLWTLFLPFGFFWLIISWFILFFRTDYFLKSNQKTKNIIYNAAPIQTLNLIEWNTTIAIESLKIKVQWNICESGKYTTGTGTNRRTVTFHKPIQSIVIFEKDYMKLLTNTSIDAILPQNISLPLDKNIVWFPTTSRIFSPINTNDGSKNIFGDWLISEIEIRFEHPDFPDKIYKFIILES